MIIYKFKSGTISDRKLKNMSYSECLNFGVTKEEYDELVKKKIIILAPEKKKTVKAKKSTKKVESNKEADKAE